MQCEMSIMGSRGDMKVLWDPANADEVAAAKAQFDELVQKKRFLAFRVKRKGEQGEQIREFDPEAGAVILVPAMQGGA